MIHTQQQRKTACFVKHLMLLAGLMLFSITLSSCGFPGLLSSSQQLPQVSQSTPTRQLPPIRFPQDEGAHRNLTEWWYYTGHLQATAADGTTRRYGFELVVFQALRSDLPALYASHFAISDIGRSEFHYDQRSIIDPHANIPDGTSSSGIDLHVGNWTIQGVNGQDHLQASMENYAIELDLLGRKQPTLHNGNGLMSLGLAGFSYYYSRTRMDVSGTLSDHNQPLTVSGQAWMDHQWGDFLAFGGGGWDWYSLQLDNQSEMMLYFIRDASGNVVSTYAGFIDASGKDSLILATSLKTATLGAWISPHTGIIYPSGWRLFIDDPRLQAVLTITPQLKDQELTVYKTTGNVYWEGAVSITGQMAGEPITGSGYVELTGYSKN